MSELAKEHGPEAVKVLAAVMNDKREAGATRISAAVAILDRAYGKPPQSMEHTGANGGAMTTRIELVAAAMSVRDDDGAA